MNKPSAHPLKNRNVYAILGMILFSPLLSLIVSVFGLALAPPWTDLTFAIMPLLSCINIPVGLILLILRKINGWVKLGLAFLIFLAPIAMMALLPTTATITGMTSCKPLPAQRPQVRFECESTSSDDAAFSYKFILQGWEYSPVMRVVK